MGSGVAQALGGGTRLHYHGHLSSHTSAPREQGRVLFLGVA